MRTRTRRQLKETTIVVGAHDRWSPQRKRSWSRSRLLQLFRLKLPPEQLFTLSLPLTLKLNACPLPSSGKTTTTTTTNGSLLERGVKAVSNTRDFLLVDSNVADYLESPIVCLLSCKLREERGSFYSPVSSCDLKFGFYEERREHLKSPPRGKLWANPSRLGNLFLNFSSFK